MHENHIIAFIEFCDFWPIFGCPGQPSGRDFPGFPGTPGTLFHPRVTQGTPEVSPGHFFVDLSMIFANFKLIFNDDLAGKGGLPPWLMRMSRMARMGMMGKTKRLAG